MAGPSERAAACDRPALAVVISCYNYERFVGQAIDSVLAQGRTDCELVVVDDGSTDRSWEVIRRSGAKAFRIDNGGQLRACLHGLAHTTAPFVLFLDADDALKPGSLGAIVERLDPSLAKLQFSLTHVDEHGAPTGQSSSVDDFRAREALLKRVTASGVYKTPPTSGNVFRRDLCELLNEVTYDPAVDGVILFAAPLFGEVLSLSRELADYRIHGRNDSGLGRAPDPATLQRDLSRFAARHAHLSRIVAQKTGRGIVAAEKAFYHRERTYYLDALSGSRPGLAQLCGLVAAMAKEPMPIKERLALAGLLVVAWASPGRIAVALVTYRLKPGARSLRGLLGQVFAKPSPSPRPRTPVGATDVGAGG